MLRELVEDATSFRSPHRPSVPYQVAVQAPDPAGKPATAHHAAARGAGAVDRYTIVYSQGSAPAVTITEAADSCASGFALEPRDVTSEPILTILRASSRPRPEDPDAGTGHAEHSCSTSDSRWRARTCSR